MAFSFEIPKPDDIKNALVSARNKITGSGGVFSGDEKTGRFSGRGINGFYTVGDSSVKITVTQKPALYPASTVKSAVADYFRGYR